MICVKLTPEQRKGLEVLRATKELGEDDTNRVEIVLRSDLGLSPPAIARRLGLSQARVRKLLRGFQADGIARTGHGQLPDVASMKAELELLRAGVADAR